LNIPEFNNDINRQDIPGPVTVQLQQLLIEIKNKQSPMYTLPLCCTVGEQYACVEQKDAYEFLVDLLRQLKTENTTIHELVTGLEGQEEICTKYPKCTHNFITGRDPFQVFTLHFPEQASENQTTIQEIVQQW